MEHPSATALASVPQPRLRAGVYGRVSVLRDASDYQHSGVETSVGRQFHECLAYCKREGWRVVQTYPDDGYSASSGRRRPSFEQLVADVEADQLDVVVVWKLDRLMRSMRDFVRVWEACQEHGARLVSVTDHLDTSSPLGKAMAQMGVIFAEIEVANTRLRVTSAYDAIRRTGQPLRIGRRPFGWAPDRVTPLRDGGNLTWTVKRKPEGGGKRVEVEVTFEAEADCLQDAGRRVVDGVASLRSIVLEWDARGVRTSTGHRIDQTMLRKLLLKPRNEPIFGPDLHRRIQAVLTDSARRTQHGTARKHLLSGGLLRCPIDPKHRVTGYVDVGRKNRKGRAAERKRAYHCPTPPAGCSGVSRLAEPLERLVCELVCRLVEADADILEPPSGDAIDAEEGALHDRWQALELRIKRYTDDYKAGELSARDRNTYTAEDQAEIEDIKSKLAKRQRRRTRANVERHKVRQRMGDAEHQDPAKLGPLEERRTLLAAYVQHIVLRPAVRGRKRFDPTAVEEPVWQEDINERKASAIWCELVRETAAAAVRTHCKHGHLLAVHGFARVTHGRSYLACGQCQADAQERHRRKVGNRCPVCDALIDPRATRCREHASFGPARRH